MLLQISGLKKRVSAYELSVGVSKSISAVWALASRQHRESIERTFATSLGVASDHVCRNAFARLGHNGRFFVELQRNVACFLQPDTRPVLQDDGNIATQPQLHAHLVIPNLVAIQPDESTVPEPGRAYYFQVTTDEIPLRCLTRSLNGLPPYHGTKSRERWSARP